MEDPKAQAKAAKKAAKAQIKREKKLAKQQAEAADAPATDTLPKQADDDSLTPAERSAAAAEQNVRLQRMRVLIAVLALVVAVITFMFTARPWQWWPQKNPAAPAAKDQPGN